jgi:hypothetical protein
MSKPTIALEIPVFATVMFSAFPAAEAHRIPLNMIITAAMIPMELTINSYACAI